MTYKQVIAAQLKAQQNVMNVNFQQEKEPLVNALKLIKAEQERICTLCKHCLNTTCSDSCAWQQIRNILKGVSHEI